MSRQIDPISAYLDAAADAHHAGVCDTEVLALHNIGEQIADFAATLADQLSKLSDGRMATRWDGRGERRAAVSFTAEDLIAAIGEGAIGELDAYPVVKAAAALRHARISATQAIAA